MDAPPPLPGGDDVVFIADDDDDLLIEDEWQADSSTVVDALSHSGQIQLQLRLCFAAVIALPVLAALIALAWRRFGDAIYSQQGAAVDSSGGDDDDDKKES